jgi:hypothetical protein
MTSIHVGVEGDQLAIKVDMAELAKELGRRLEQCEQTAGQARQRWEESEWYLGEARATIAILAARLEDIERARDDTARERDDALRDRDDAVRERDELGQHLAESRRAHARLLEQTIELQDQLTAAQAEVEATQRILDEHSDRLGVVANGPRTAGAELEAIQTASERRRALRVRRSDVTVELQRPDGAVLFSGPLRDISRTGVGFDAKQLESGAAELLWLTLHPEGRERPIEALARLSWLRQDESSGSYEGGCELIDVSPGSRSALEEMFAGDRSTSAG